MSPKKPFPPAGSRLLLHVCVGGIRKSVRRCLAPLGGRARSSTPTPELICSGPERSCDRSQNPDRHVSLQDCAYSVNSSNRKRRNRESNNNSFFFPPPTGRPRWEEEARVPRVLARAPFLTKPMWLMKNIHNVSTYCQHQSLFFSLMLLPDFGRPNGPERVCFFFQLYV